MKPLTPERSRAKFNYHIQTGEIKKPEKCSICQKKHRRIHAHHENYEMIFKIFWLCPPCHKKWHSVQRRFGLGIYKEISSNSHKSLVSNHPDDSQRHKW
jgi:hypothetical protein